MIYKFGFKLFMTILLTGFSAFGANAATYTVMNTNDSGAGSLRDAVAAANGQTADDTLNFNIPATDANCASGVCTIILTSGEILINATSATGKLTISNPNGANRIIISGNNNFRILYIRMGDSEAVIDGVAIERGAGVGATNPNVSGFGGGIYVEALSISPAKLTISNTGFSNNAGHFGGGIYSVGSKLAIINSAFIANGAQLDGGGIYNYGSTITIANSTINSGAAGQTGGGIFNYLGTTTITNATISRNRSLSNTLPGNVSPSGGIANFSNAATKTFIRNTIVADNIAADAPRDIYHGSADTFTSNGNNLIGISINTGTTIVWQPTDIRNQSPRLAPVGDNGGTTPTEALLADSPAINTGNNCVLTANACGDGNAAIVTDQRGLIRQSGAAVDIGAFELQSNRKTPFDFDGDGKSDVAVARNNGGNLVWYLLNSQSGFTGVNFGIATDRIVPADYDGDGKTDIAVVRTNANNTLSWYLLQSRDGFIGQTFGIAGDTPVPADYDGDGRADITVTRVTSGALSWYINRSQLGFVGYQFGATGDVPVVGDYDGDGKTDAAVVRQSGGNLSWYINRSQLGFAGYQFGLASDKPIAADYDGDGKTDVAVTRNIGGNMNWYLLQSGSGFAGVAFGAAGDVPVPADYDGDGKTDAAVTRANGGALNWYLLRSQSGFTGVGFGASSDRAVENAYIP